MSRDTDEESTKGGAEGQADEEKSLAEREYARPVSDGDKDTVSGGVETGNDKLTGYFPALYRPGKHASRRRQLPYLRLLHFVNRKKLFTDPQRCPLL